jgi:uncharacterized phiE125 gp8 family phage protein
MSGSGSGTPVTGVPGGVGWGMVTAPTLLPLTLAELKTHLRIDSETLAGNLESTQSIAPGSHATTTLYSLVGTAVNVAGKQAIVYLESGTNGATGTVDAKIQEFNGTTWADWTGGAFTQVTEATDNATYERAYTGTASQIRVVAKVLLAACEFGVSIVTNSAITSEDDDLTDLILDAVEAVEGITCRALLTQTWDYVLMDFPAANFILIPLGNLQSITSITWKNVSGVVTTMTENTDYIVELNGDSHGRVVLPYAKIWPVDVLWPSNPVTIRFICGWTTADLVPRTIKRAVKFICETNYYHGDRDDILDPVIEDMLQPLRLWGDFNPVMRRAYNPLFSSGGPLW